MVDVNVEPLEIEVRSRHGDLVRADVYLPKGRTGPFPTLLTAAPYQKSLRRLPAETVFPFIEYGPMQLYLDEGYAYVVMDVPGSGVSEGKWDFVSKAEGEAIHDMIEHAAEQPWSTGDVGMIGMSYLTWSQWNAARTRPPHLKTIAAFDGATDMYRDWMYHGGIPPQTFLNGWLVCAVLLQHQAEGHVMEANGRGETMYEIYAHRFDDEWQRSRSPYWELDKVDIPVFSIGAWGKRALHLRGNITGYQRVSGPKKLLVVDTASFGQTQLLFADEAFHRRELLPWYDHHLKGIDNGVMDGPNVRITVQAEGAIREATDWPPPCASPSSFYLSANKSGHVTSLNDGSLTEEAPPEDGGATSWSYPQRGWAAGVTTFDARGVPDHFALVNTFTSQPFEHDREFTGQGVLLLHASSDQTDMDVIVRLSLLSDREDQPAVRKVSQGWLRASHRAEDPALTEPLRPFHKHDRAEPITPGEIYELRIEMMPMSFLVRAGDRIRLEISNWESAITEAPMTHWYGQKIGSDTYYHNALHPSQLILHECPRDDAAG
jgi:putative CocE/NonD family hydrolase